MGMAVGRDRFRADAHEVMKFMQALQQQELDPDDPTGGYMLQVLAVTLSMAHYLRHRNEEHVTVRLTARPPLIHPRKQSSCEHWQVC